MCRGYIDDPPETSLLHRSKRCLNEVEGRGQVDGNDLVPLLRWKGFDRRDMLDPGIVDDDVNMAEPLSGLARHRANRFRLRHVGAVVGNVDVVVFGERRPKCFNFGLVTEAVQHDGGAPLGKGAGNCEGRCHSSSRSRSPPFLQAGGGPSFVPSVSCSRQALRSLHLALGVCGSSGQTLRGRRDDWKCRDAMNSMSIAHWPQILGAVKKPPWICTTSATSWRFARP